MSENDVEGDLAVMERPHVKYIKSVGGGDGKLDSGIDEESILDRISHLKLSSDDVEDSNNNECLKGAVTTGDTDGNSEKENSVTTNESKHEEPAIDGKKWENGGVLPQNVENSKSSKPESPKGSQSPQSPGRMSPAEFFQTSRLRCSALANKLNTTQAFGGSVELSNAESDTSSGIEEITKGVESVILDEKKERKASDEKEDDQDDKGKEKSAKEEGERELIDRSPVPGYTANRHAPHPYQQPQQARYPPNCQASPSRYHQMKVDDAQSFSPAYYMEQQRYKAGGQPRFCPSRQQPHAVPSPTYSEYGNYGNAMWSPPNGYCQQQQPGQDPAMNNQYNQQPFAPEQLIDISPPSSVINSLADMCQMMSSKSPLAVLSPLSFSPMQPTDAAKVDGLIEEKPTADSNADAKPIVAARELDMEELPDELCDFILTYSRQYTLKNDMALSGDKSNPGSVENKEPRSAPCTPAMASTGQETVSDGHSPEPANDGSSALDMMFSPAFYSNSPNAYSPQQPRKEENSPSSQSDDAGKQSQPSSARNRLREQIDQKDLDSALAWAMRCCQSRPEALFFRDKDGDSLLHIVIWHKDLAKIYVLTEIILKSTQGSQPSAPKLFDLPNKQNETPLFLSVEKGLNDVVAYLLECGADPSICPNYGDAEPPLHYAAARGMTDIVQTLCTGGRGGVNMLNSAGMTPLLCAVKNHGNLNGENQCMVDNSMVIKTLLKAGADAGIQDASSGKNVLHFCVEHMDPAMIQLFGDHTDRNVMARLVNSCDYNGFTPLSLVSGSALMGAGGPDEEKLRQKMSKLLLEYSVGQNLSADDFGDLSYLLSDQVPADGVQFAMLDAYLSSQAY